MLELVISLDSDSVGRAVGGKAASLMRLRAAGFPVPPGVVVAPDILDGQLASAARQAIAHLPGHTLAIRSSAVGEDGFKKSFAGQFDSILHVAPTPEHVADAISQVRASLSADHVAQYDGDATEMAVLIMPMLAPEAAGIAFTRDPVSGSEVVVIEAVAGVADRLAAGTTSGERWTVNATAESESLTATVLTPDQASQIAELARRVEAASDGQPQDIEWAIAGGTVVLLQARPITTIGDLEPIPLNDDIPPGLWQWDSTHSQRPNSPFLASYFPEAMKRASSRIAQEYGVPISHLALRSINGYFHIQVVPPVGKPGDAPPPAPILRLAFSVVPILRNRNAAARRLTNERTDRMWAERWRNEQRPSFESTLESWRAYDLGALSNDELLNHLDTAIDTVSECFAWTMMTDFSYLLPLLDLSDFVSEHFALDMSNLTTLLAGAATSEYAQSLTHLATLMPDDVRRAIASGQPLSPEAVPVLMDAFHAHQDRYATRGLGYDLIVPTLGELVIDELAIVAKLKSGSDPSEEARRLADSLRSGLSEEARAEFDARLAEARATYPIREENEDVHARLAGAVRLVALEAGRRMVLNGDLDSREHVFYLSNLEVIAWLRSPSAVSDTVNRRRGEELWALANPPAAFLGDSSDAVPNHAAFPLAPRRALRALLLVAEHDMRPASDTPEGHGVAASAGTHTGPVRLVAGPQDFSKVQPNDIIVAPLTTSAWEVLFTTAGALVTEGGGLLSHPAIVAREYGLPAVVGYAGAMHEFSDGQIVTVDGTLGTVVPQELG